MRQNADSLPPVVEFNVRVVLRKDRLTVVVRGEIDLSTAREFAEALDVAMALRPNIELNLRRTTFLDSTGIKLLVDAHNRLGQIPGAIVLRDPSPAVRRVLDLAGVGHYFTVA